MIKKVASAFLLLTIIMILSACSNNSELPKVLTKEGISPYELSESEKYILQAFNMKDTSQIISFNAPKEAVSLNVNVYRLEGAENWIDIGGGGISIWSDRKPTDQLTGTFTMQLKNNYAIEFAINSGGTASYKTDEIILDSEIISSTKGFLQEFQSITTNTEIPVALMVYDDSTRMESYSLQDFFEPSKLADMDLVQAVTLEFSTNP